MACFDEDTWAQGVDWCAAPVQLPEPCLCKWPVPLRQLTLSVLNTVSALCRDAVEQAAVKAQSSLRTKQARSSPVCIKS